MRHCAGEQPAQSRRFRRPMTFHQSTAEPDRALHDATHTEINSPTRSGSSRRRRAARGAENEAAQPHAQQQAQGAAQGAANMTPLRGTPQQRRNKAGAPTGFVTVRRTSSRLCKNR